MRPSQNDTNGVSRVDGDLQRCTGAGDNHDLGEMTHIKRRAVTATADEALELAASTTFVK